MHAFTDPHFNLSSKRELCFTYSQVSALDRQIKDTFDEWVEAAPVSYTSDDFIVNRTPIIITSRYGQNQELQLDDEGFETEARSWSQYRRCRAMHYMTIAIASHLWYIFQCFIFTSI